MIKKNAFKLFVPFFALFYLTSCGMKNDVPDKETTSDSTNDISGTYESSVETEDTQTGTSVSDPGNDYVYEDNIWAAFLVSPQVPAYTDREEGNDILSVLCYDSVIGSVAAMSQEAEPPEDTVAYGTEVITAGGPVEYSDLAFGRLSEVPDSFLNAMVSDMKSEIGDYYGEHSSGAGMGYRTFYQASYDVDSGALQVNQSDGYWARTLGAFSEHCAGVAVDFDISYDNSEYLERTGTENREGDSAANTEFRWLADNAHKYGFIWRYKIDGSDVSASGYRTGTIREGWHWRFVGVYHATKFWEQCASDTDGDGKPDSGYMTNDNYIWEDYYYSNIYGNPRYPQNEHDGIFNFYMSPNGNVCTYSDYRNSAGSNVY